MASPDLHVRLFGEFSISFNGAPVRAANGARLQALLAYLLLHRESFQPRQQLAAVFWPDMDEGQARNNLRQLLHQVRRALPAADVYLYADAACLGWRPEAAIALDVADFEGALALAGAAERDAEPDGQRRALAAAVAVYRGELLPGCYDDWIAPERERLRRRFVGALALLARLSEEQRDLGAAIEHARRWLQHDPLAEEAYRTLMRLLALTDDRAGALRVYRTCAAVLRRELGVEPGPATRALYQRLARLDALPVPDARDDPAIQASAFVGREREWVQLQAAWRQASAAGPRFVLVTGEAGIGKSRLAEELLAWARRQGVVVAQARSYAAEGQLSLAPVTDWLRSDALRPGLARLDPVWLTEISRLLPEFSATPEPPPAPAPVTEYGQRLRFFEALAHALLAAPQPLLLLLDDMQWCDGETLEWLHFLLRFDPAAHLLVVGCARAEELPPEHPLRSLLLHLEATTGVTEIALAPLSAAETARLAAQIGGRELGGDWVLHLYEETAGIPLFVIETVRAGVTAASGRQGDAPLVADQPPGDGRTPLPPRVYGVIAGRLAQLSASARSLLGLAAAVGRAFSLDLLLAAGAGDEEDVVRVLDELWTKRLIREQGANGYDFSHDKLREVAYAEIGLPQRRLFHRRIAQALAASGGDLDSASGEIAAHYERAGLAEQAIPHYQRAAAVAERLYANDDAIHYLTRALTLLEQLPAGAERDRRELDLLLLLAPALRIAKGWAAPELERTLDRAQALCASVGDDAQRARVLDGLQSLLVVQAKLEVVQHLYEALDALHRRSFGRQPPLFAGVMLSGARLHLGHLADANDRFAKIIAVHDPDQLQHLQEVQGVNYMVLARAWHAHALWCLGYPASALDRGRGAGQLARDLAQPFNQALAAAYLATLAQLGAEPATARAEAEHALALAIDFKAPYYRAWSAILAAHAQAWERPDAAHSDRLRAAIIDFTAAGARLRLPYFLALLAQVQARAGRGEDGLATIAEAFAAARAHDEHWWDAELHRLRGELLLARGAAPAAEAALLQAVAVARGQKAKSLELRAALSLARLWRASRRADEGRRLLAELCTWFTEGRDTPDLAAARSLLADLT